MRVWDARALGRGALGAVACGGGVWRVKWHPPAGAAARGASARAGDGLLLAACMRGCVVLVDNALPELAARDGPRAEAAAAAAGPRVALRQAAHGEGQLAYGVAWCAEDGAAEDGAARCALAASCSFYDHALRVWPLPADRGGGVF